MRRTSILPLALLASAIAAMVAPVQVMAQQKPAGVTSAQPGNLTLPGRAFEFRGQTTGPKQGMTDHIWKFSADGRVTSMSTERMGGALGGEATRTISHEGTWHLQQARLCVQWRGAHKPYSACYRIEAEQGYRVRLHGSPIFSGTLEPSE